MSQNSASQIAKFMGPTWGPPVSCRCQMGPMLVPWTLLSGVPGGKKLLLAKETLDHDIDPLMTVHFADLKPLVNSYIQQEVQIKWDVSIHGRDLYLLKPTLGPPKRFRHLTRAEEVVITRLRIGHTKATKSYILSRGTPTACQHCGQTLTIEHILLECTVLQQSRDDYYTVGSLRTLFETIPETCIIKFLRDAGFYYLIWMAWYPTLLFIKSVTNWRHSQVELIPTTEHHH